MTRVEEVYKRIKKEIHGSGIKGHILVGNPIFKIKSQQESMGSKHRAFHAKNRAIMLVV